MRTKEIIAEELFDKLWPLCRSILGAGFRDSLSIISQEIPLNWISFSSGESVLDWTIPSEWVVRDAYIITPDGNKIANFKLNNLHLIGYSAPFKGRISLGELKKHLYTKPDLVDAIPYVTSYYERRWGFCISHNQLLALKEGEYTVYIDTEFVDGNLVLGEGVLPGGGREILFSTYLCHPSMANHELSGPILMALLYKKIKSISNRKYTYRFVVCPETIGAISYLSLRGEWLKKHIDAGYVITCVGDSGPYTYKSSRRGDSLSDRVAKVVLKDYDSISILPFVPFGSDERQYCSPGYNLPVGSLMRSIYGSFKEYHTSMDNKDYISFTALVDTLEVYEKIVDVLEFNFFPISKHAKGEPHLGKRGLYSTISGANSEHGSISALMWILNLADGENDLISISDKSGLSIFEIIKFAKIALENKLIERYE